MKGILKKTILIIFILLLLFSINAKVFAWSEIISDGKDFLQQAETSSTGIQALQEASGYIYNILLAAGVVIAVIVATVLGVQFMTGGAEGQAKVKEMMLPFVVGCVIVFGGFGFWKIAITVGESLEAAGSMSPIGSSEENTARYTVRNKESMYESCWNKCCRYSYTMWRTSIYKYRNRRDQRHVSSRTYWLF